MTDKEKIARIVLLCNSKINEQKRLELTSGYGNMLIPLPPVDDYTEGRTVGSAALARRILQIIRGEE